jgi:hypothetical protein
MIYLQTEDEGEISMATGKRTKFIVWMFLWAVTLCEFVGG